MSGHFVDELRTVFADRAGHPALVHRDHVYSYAELDKRARRAAAWDAPAARLRDHAIGADDACLMIYSSGTTGRPKGVVHTPANLSASLRALQACWRITADDTVVNVLPLFHIHGLSFACLLPLL